MTGRFFPSYGGLTHSHPFWIPAPHRGTGHAFDRWNDEMSGGSLFRIVVRTCFHSNRSSRLAPAHQGMKSRSCGFAQRIGTADSATLYDGPMGNT